MTTSTPRPLPAIQAEAAAFWDGCRAERLLLQRCDACGAAQFYPRPLCSTCWSRSLSWVDSTGGGAVHSYTVVHRPPSPAFADLVPYVIALIDLDEGPRMLSHVVGPNCLSTSIGARVSVIFEDIGGDVSLPVFELVDP